MATEIDPEGREIEALRGAADFRDARVLEIGCGAGRLIRRYADASRFVAGVDTAAESLAAARSEAADVRTRQAGYVQAAAFPLPFVDRAFDVVVYGWSL
jgi:ubiquinone/menaquinone biosynthesis C-methylase UbiE